MSGISQQKSIFWVILRIAWRKLNFKLENHHYDIIENFIIKTLGTFIVILGKKFDISLDKVLSFQSKLKREK